MANGGLCCVAVRFLLRLYHTADHMRMCVFGLLIVFFCRERQLVLLHQSTVPQSMLASNCTLFLIICMLCL
jgi:hypothetical protein